MFDRTLIDRYERDAETPLRSIAGLTSAELLAFPIPGTWSIQQIVLHWMESDLISTDRMKRIIAMDRPQIIAYDETAFSQKLFHHEMDVQAAGQVFALNRRMTAALLRRLPDEAFDRVGVHSQRGSVTLADFVKIYIDHVESHLVHLRRKRELLGKPLSH